MTSINNQSKVKIFGCQPSHRLRYMLLDTGHHDSPDVGGCSSLSGPALLSLSVCDISSLTRIINMQTPLDNLF